MEAVSLLLGLSLGESDGEEVDGSLEGKGVETFLERLEHIFEYLSADVVNLVEALYSVLDDLGNGDNLVHSVAHGSEGDLVGSALSELREDVGNVVAEGLSGGDAYLVVWSALRLVSDLAICLRHFFLNGNDLFLFIY